MLRRADLGLSAAERALGVNQIDGTIVVAALTTIVSRLVLRTTLGARPADKSVRQKRPSFRVVKLRDVGFLHQAGFANCSPNLATQHAVLFAVRAVVVVKFDVKARN